MGAILRRLPAFLHRLLLAGAFVPNLIASFERPSLALAAGFVLIALGAWASLALWARPRWRVAGFLLALILCLTMWAVAFGLGRGP